MKENIVWGIHGGAEWEADELFREKNIIAIGWPKIGDLSKYPDREAYKNAYLKFYPADTVGAVRNAAGIFFRFVHEMKIGDMVVYPSRPTNVVYIGKITGEYQFAPNFSSNFPNQRIVKWLTRLPRTSFSQGALYEIGSALTLFQVRNNADEFIAAAAGKPEPPSDKQDSEESAKISADIETQTNDFVLKQIKLHFKGEALEDLIVHLLETMGYHARKMPKNNPSVDIIAHKDELGFEPPIIKCQVKSEEGTIGLDPVEKLNSHVNQNEFGLLITLSDFNKNATQFAESKPNLRLVDGYTLVDMLLNHYTELDNKYRNAIPLRQVFLPNPTSK